MTVDQQFNSLNEKLQLLLKQFNRLQKENERLRTEVEEARQEHGQMKQKVQELEQQVTLLRISSGEMTDTDKKEFEKRINQYLREVDKCIAFLSQ